ncbi:MAG: YigZ family protein [Bacillaceae bacterium]|nr:YigZ family protein [Bacillaceae bacterium]
MLKEYLTVKGYGETEIIINKSRFISYVNRAETEEEAIQFIEQIKKKHWDATHNCSAYIVGEHDQHQKANDDGEPSGTAGKPILEVIKKNQLKDTVIVVTRYFGGIKLGAGGLIRAYGQSASEGIQAAGIVKRSLMTQINITIDYNLLGKVENELRSANYPIENTEYLDKVTITTLVPQGKEHELEQFITDITSASASLTTGDTLYVELPYNK